VVPPAGLSRVGRQRTNLGIDRTPCEQCGHRADMHFDRVGVRVCIVCERLSPPRPCSEVTLRNPPSDVRDNEL